MDGNESQKLASRVEQIERLHEEKKVIEGEISDVFRELRGDGFDVKVVKIVIRLRREDASEVEERDILTDTYLRAISDAQHGTQRSQARSAEPLAA